MKIVAAIMDIKTLRFFKQGMVNENVFVRTKTKRFLVYDPREVTSRHVEKKEDERWL